MNFNSTHYDKKHFETIEQYVKRIKRIYASTLLEAAHIAASLGVQNPDKIFSFDDNAILKQRADALFKAMANQMLSLITTATSSQWSLSERKNDDLVNSVLRTSELPKESVDKYLEHNLKALDSFQKRKVNGMNLSDRVWRQTEQFKNEIELGLDIGIGEGKSADQLARDLQSNLNEPERLFRRVRDKHGNLKLSKAAQAYNPGRGVYRSSYKNAQRLARSEINSAYRIADHERWDKLDFVVGIEIKRSNNLTDCDICGPLVGRYPKDFKFVGFHPSCRCFVVSILASREELNKLEQMLLNDEDTSKFKSANQVSEVHKGYKDWVVDNKDRILRAKSLPYFLKDNPGFSGLKVG